jgi:uncharacterized protein YjbI with pentapeptide repeats
MGNSKKFNQKQYSLLVSCAAINDMTKWDQYLEDTERFGINLDGANFSKEYLTDVNLIGANLRGANLNDTNFSGADLSGADLREANLKGANLSEADLTEANLIGTNLQDADFSEAKLCRVDLSGRDLRDTGFFSVDFKGANLRGSVLCGENLIGYNFMGADLVGANLSDTNLSFANFRRAQLKNVNLSGTKLTGVDFSGMDLSEINLSNSILKTARLVSANFSHSIITGACLYGTSRDDWIINGIECDYVYWDKDGKERTPKDRNFKPGEFEELYKSLPEVTYYFSDEFSPLTPIVMDKVVTEINNKNPHFDLHLDSFHSRGTPHAVFTVLHKEFADEAHDALTNGYERTIQRLEGKNEALCGVISTLIDQSQTINVERIEHMGNTFGNIQSDRDIIIATDQGTINVTQDVINRISKTISESDSSPDYKQDAQQQLDNINKELNKPEPDKSRIKRCYDYVVGVIPRVAEVVPWGKLIEKTLGL